MQSILSKEKFRKKLKTVHSLKTKNILYIIYIYIYITLHYSTVQSSIVYSFFLGAIGRDRVFWLHVMEARLKVVLVQLNNFLQLIKKKSHVNINLYLNIGILPIDICFWQVREVWEIQEERSGSISLQGRMPIFLPESLLRERPVGSLEIRVFSSVLRVQGEAVFRRTVICSECVLGKKATHYNNNWESVQSC